MKYPLIFLLFCYASLSHSAGLSSFYDKSFVLGADYRSWDNREFKNGSQLMRDYGNLLGVDLKSHNIYDEENWMLTALFNYISGKTKYDGQLQSGTPYQSNSQNLIFTVSLEFLRGFAVGESLFGVHFGIAKRMLYNEELPEEPADYSRRITYWYLPIGLRFVTGLGEGNSLELDFTYQLFLSGKVETALTETGLYTSDIINDQNKGMGLSASVALMTSRFKVSVYTHYWSIKDSETALSYGVDSKLYQFYEPENTTKSYGVLLSVRF